MLVKIFFSRNFFHRAKIWSLSADKVFADKIEKNLITSNGVHDTINLQNLRCPSLFT